ncbi:hypothetical protein [Thalassobius sp. Cn5-15]|uniref:hypothetical protein n=1 Tax=Thalassobius sp. Cn5-15 TaxID=2917763 RepID=UPI001EF3B21C|nr:hypothetical protein [Thalassobius sp. Cn5-15]MCG7492996.1 hypothetical protein [Thalassobius sp. Cn5-15]
MLRIFKPVVRTATVTACLLAASLVQAETAEEREARCTAQSAIVEKAVQHRLDSRSQKRADKLVRRSDEIKDSPYEQHVDLLVNWVYTLPEAQLGPEVSATFATACNQYEG